MASHQFITSFAIVIYVGLGVFDEKGLIAGWPLVFFRLSYLSVYLLVYLAYLHEHHKTTLLY